VSRISSKLSALRAFGRFSRMIPIGGSVSTSMCAYVNRHRVARGLCSVYRVRIFLSAFYLEVLVVSAVARLLSSRVAEVSLLDHLSQTLRRYRSTCLR